MDREEWKQRREELLAGKSTPEELAAREKEIIAEANEAARKKRLSRKARNDIKSDSDS